MAFFEWTEQEHLRDLSMGFFEMEMEILWACFSSCYMNWLEKNHRHKKQLQVFQQINCLHVLDIFFWGSLPAESAGEMAGPLHPSNPRASRFCLSLNVDVLAEKLGSGGRWGGGMGKVMVSGTFQSLEDFLDFVGEKNPRRVNWFVWVLDIIIYIFLFRSSVIT